MSNNTDLRYYIKNINNIDISDDQLVVFNKYINAIVLWNKTHNLISSNKDVNSLIVEIVDCIIGARYLKVKTDIFDAGSGNGLPGIVLAIIYPNNNFILVESSRKKCSFLRMVKTELQLNNLSIKNIRIEELSDIFFIVSKAAFSVKNIGILEKSLSNKGKLALWTTPGNEEALVIELANHGLSLIEKFPYLLPQHGARVILVFSKN